MSHVREELASARFHHWLLDGLARRGITAESVVHTLADVGLHRGEVLVRVRWRAPGQPVPLEAFGRAERRLLGWHGWSVYLAGARLLRSLS